MLPFIKDKEKTPTVTVVKTKSDSDKNESVDDVEEALQLVARDVLSAISSNNYKMLATALKSAFEIMDASPHYEGEHLND